jgi:hypothetical protein
VSRSATNIFTLSADRLRELLALAVDRPSEYASLLARAKQVDGLEVVLADALGTADVATQMLTDLRTPGTAIETLLAIRDRAKALINGEIENAGREAATLVYHAATAAAIGRHGINLSSVPPESRLPLYEDLATVLANDPLAAVFREAADHVNQAREKP